MIKQPTVQQLESFSRICDTDDGQALCKWLKESINATNSALTWAVEGLHVLQGRGQALEEVLRHIETAHDTAQKIRSKRTP